MEGAVENPPSHPLRAGAVLFQLRPQRDDLHYTS